MGQKVNPLGFRLGVSQKHISHWFVDNSNYSQLVVEDQFIRNFFVEKFPDIASIHIKRDLNKIEIEIFSANTRTLLIEYDPTSNKSKAFANIGQSTKNYVAPSKDNESQFSEKKDALEGPGRNIQGGTKNASTPANSLCDQLLKKLTIYRYTSFLKRKLQSKNRTDTSKLVSSKVTGQNTFGEKKDSFTPSNVQEEKTTRPVFDPQVELGVVKKPIEISLLLTKVENPNTSAACIAEFIVEQLEKRVPFRRVIKRAIQKAEEADVQGIKVQISGRLNGAEIARSERIHKGQVPLHTLRAKIEYNSRTAKTIYGLLGVKVWVFHGFANLND